MNAPKTMTQGLAKALVVAGLAATLVAASAAAAEPSPERSVDPGAVEATEAPATSFPMATDVYPLPDLTGDPSELPTVSLGPESGSGWAVGVAQPYDLGHCGIFSPVDVDGSLWQPLVGTGSDGGPIESDEDIGQLINATPGLLVLVTEDTAVFVSETGLRVELARAPGSLEYFLCE